MLPFRRRGRRLESPEPPGGTCRWCGGKHDGPMCPFVKAIEFDPEGNVSRVEFIVPADMGAPVKEAPKAEEPEPDYPRKRPMTFGAAGENR